MSVLSPVDHLRMIIDVMMLNLDTLTNEDVVGLTKRANDISASPHLHAKEREQLAVQVNRIAGLPAFQAIFQHALPHTKESVSHQLMKHLRDDLSNAVKATTDPLEKRVNRTLPILDPLTLVCLSITITATQAVEGLKKTNCGRRLADRCTIL